MRARGHGRLIFVAGGPLVARAPGERAGPGVRVMKCQQFGGSVVEEVVVYMDCESVVLRSCDRPVSCLAGLPSAPSVTG